MQSRKHAAAVAIGAGLAAALQVGPAGAQTLGELQEQIRELKVQVEALRTRAAPAAPAAPAAAVDPENQPATLRDIEGVRTEIENYKYDQKRSRETATATTTRGTAIGGSVQARYSVGSPPVNSGSTSTAGPRSNSFDIPAASVNFSGSLYRDYIEGRNLDYRLQLAYAKNSPANNNSQFNLQDAYLRYNLTPTTTGLEDPRVHLTLGQQQIPYGLEAQVGEELRPVINSAQFLSRQGVGTRQIGAILRGDYDPYVDYGFNYRAPLIEYAFGVVNGAGPNKSDDNNHKDIIARVASTLPVDYNSVFRELKFGASYYKGKANLLSNGVLARQGDSTRYGLDVYYNHAPFGVTYEYSQGRTERLAGDKVRDNSHVLTLFYTWGEQWFASSRAQAKYDDWWPKSHQLFARLDRYDPNAQLANDRSTIYTLGYNLFFAQTTKLQLNLNHYQYDDPNQRSARELLLQFQFGF